MTPREALEKSQAEGKVRNNVMSAGLDLIVAHENWEASTQCSKWESAWINYIALTLIRSPIPTEYVKQAKDAPSFIQVWRKDELVPRL